RMTYAIVCLPAPSDVREPRDAHKHARITGVPAAPGVGGIDIVVDSSDDTDIFVQNTDAAGQRKWPGNRGKWRLFQHAPSRPLERPLLQSRCRDGSARVFTCRLVAPPIG